MAIPFREIKTEAPPCVTRIRKRIERINGDEKITVNDARRLLVDFADCFTMFEIATRTRLDRLETVLIAIRESQQSDKASQQPVKDSDTFKAMLNWLKKYTLPKLVELLILAILAWIILEIRATH